MRKLDIGSKILASIVLAGIFYAAYEDRQVFIASFELIKQVIKELVYG